MKASEYSVISTDVLQNILGVLRAVSNTLTGEPRDNLLIAIDRISKTKSLEPVISTTFDKGCEVALPFGHQGLSRFEKEHKEKLLNQDI